MNEDPNSGTPDPETELDSFVKRRTLTYLACPYSFNGRDDLRAREARFQIVTKVAARLMSEGRAVFSPITHGHPMNMFGVTVGWDTWAAIDEAILSRCCKEMIVLTLDGWRESKGIAAEIAIATLAGIPIAYMDSPKVEQEQVNENH